MLLCAMLATEVTRSVLGEPVAGNLVLWIFLLPWLSLVGKHWRAKLRAALFWVVLALGIPGQSCQQNVGEPGALAPGVGQRRRGSIDSLIFLGSDTNLGTLSLSGQQQDANDSKCPLTLQGQSLSPLCGRGPFALGHSRHGFRMKSYLSFYIPV